MREKEVPSSSGSCRQHAAKEVHEVAVIKAFDVGCGVAAGGEQAAEAAEVGDAVEVERRLFGAEAAVEIAADPDVARVACNLADVVDMVADLLDRQAERPTALIFRLNSLERSIACGG
jgi:catabolite regulation protein CreA